MIVKELLQSCRMVLQDYDKTYWDDSELLSYYNECKRTMASERLEIKSEATLVLDPDTNKYTTDGILRYIKATDDLGGVRTLYPNDGSGDGDDNGIVIKDYNKIYINRPDIGSIITFEIVTLPDNDNLESSVRMNDENSFKYYILSKCYEKENDMENFQKVEYFHQKYLREFRKNIDSASANYVTATVSATEGSYY